GGQRRWRGFGSCQRPHLAFEYRPLLVGHLLGGLLQNPTSPRGDVEGGGRVIRRASGCGAWFLATTTSGHRHFFLVLVRLPCRRPALRPGLFGGRPGAGRRAPCLPLFAKKKPPRSARQEDPWGWDSLFRAMSRWSVVRSFGLPGRRGFDPRTWEGLHAG